MSGTVLIVVGLVLGLAGLWSIRWAFVAAGVGAGWLLASAFGASAGAILLVALGVGLVVMAVAVLASKTLFLAVGAIVGTVVGARLFMILDGGRASVALAVVFVPAVAVCFAVLLGRWRERLLGWATAIAGSALVLSGIGRLAPDTLGALYSPTDVPGQLVSSGSWVVLAVLARLGQHEIQVHGGVSRLARRRGAGDTRGA